MIQLVKHTFRNIFLKFIVMVDPVYTIVYTHKKLFEGQIIVIDPVMTRNIHGRDFHIEPLQCNPSSSVQQKLYSRSHHQVN